jgi:hypothetical protein
MDPGLHVNLIQKPRDLNMVTRHLFIMKRLLPNSKDIFYLIYYKKNWPRDLLEIAINMYRNNSLILKLDGSTTTVKV